MRRTLGCGLASLALLWTSTGLAAEAADSSVSPAAMGRAVMLEGQVWVVAAGRTAESPPTDLRLGQRLWPGSVLTTGEQGRVRILMANRSVVDLGPRSRIRLSYIAGERRSRVGIFTFFGRLWARVASGQGEDRFEVKTKNAVAGVRGTSFFLATPAPGEEGDTRVSVTAGTVRLGGEGAEAVDIEAMHEGRFRHGTSRAQIRRLPVAEILSLRHAVTARPRFAGDKARLGQWRAKLTGQGKGRRVDRSTAAKRVRQRLRRRVRRRLARGLTIDPAEAEAFFERRRRR